MIVTCDNPECRYVWDYTGKMRYSVNCPDCGKRTKLQNDKLESKEEVKEDESQ